MSAGIMENFVRTREISSMSYFHLLLKNIHYNIYRRNLNNLRTERSYFEYEFKIHTGNSYGSDFGGRNDFSATDKRHS